MHTKIDIINSIKNPKVHFTSEPEQKQPETANVEEPEENFIARNKYALMAIGTIALGGIIYMATRGRGGKNIVKPQTTSAPAQTTATSAGSEINRTFNGLYQDAIKAKQPIFNDAKTGKTYHFTYDKDGNLTNEIVKKGDDFIGEYEIVAGKSRPLRLHRGNWFIEYKYKPDGSKIRCARNNDKIFVDKIIKKEYKRPEKLPLFQQYFDQKQKFKIVKSFVYNEDSKIVTTVKKRNGKLVRKIENTYDKRSYGKPYELKRKAITYPNGNTRTIVIDGVNYHITDSVKPNERIIRNKMGDITHITKDSIIKEFKVFGKFYKEEFKKDSNGKIIEYTIKEFENKQAAQNGTYISVGKGMLKKCDNGLFAGGDIIHYIQKDADGIVTSEAQYLPHIMDEYGVPQQGYLIDLKNFEHGALIEEMSHRRDNDKIFRTTYQYINDKKVKTEEYIFDRLDFISNYTKPMLERRFGPLQIFKYNPSNQTGELERTNVFNQRIKETIQYEKDGITIKDKKIYKMKSRIDRDFSTETKAEFKDGKLVTSGCYCPFRKETLNLPEKSELKKIIEEKKNVEYIVTDVYGGKYWLLDKDKKLVSYVQEYKIDPKKMDLYEHCRQNPEKTLAYEELPQARPDSLSFAEVIECMEKGLY